MIDKNPYLPSPNKKIWHEKDKEYFKEYAAPVMENYQRMHFTNINSTISFLSPMMYFLIRALCCEHVLEIGVAEGFTAFNMANAVKDNGTRFGMKGNMYYGVDNRNIHVHEHLDDRGLPNKILYMDSKDLTSDTFKGVTFDLIFQDGDHSEEAIVREFDLFWPQLKKGGKGYFVMHDTQGPGELGWRRIKEKLDNKEVQAEYVTLDCVYGMTIIRNTEGFDYAKRHWKD